MTQFQEQIDRLVTLGYPALSDLSEPQFEELLEPLRSRAERLTTQERPGQAPWVIVIRSDLIDPERTIPLLRLSGGTTPGVVDRSHRTGDLATYQPLDMLDVPSASAYLLVDVHRGEEFCGVAPEQALPVITARGRTPLTIEEGVALVTHAPQLLEKNRCFMLSGSRRGDRRVPALWISGRAPKLGWCWDGNPHSWLGVASAGARLAA
ncbi:MAG: DUF5701 family protein [Ornithinimicrobium sp.]|jgi:hypothetical protein|uniref:DUF5701 family protein n=1 Tax=Ornithinimicrobium sp. TaxID=1977084 RepID=UPI003D9B63D0